MSRAVRELRMRVAELQVLLDATRPEMSESWWYNLSRGHDFLRTALSEAEKLPALCDDCGGKVSSHDIHFCARCGDERGP